MPLPRTIATGRALLGGGFRDPSSLPGLALWLRADSGVYSGNAAAFVAASSQWLSHVDNASLSTGDIDFTIAGWVKATSLAGAICCFAKYNSAGNQREWAIDTNPTTPIFTVSSNGTLTTGLTAGTALTAGAWAYIVAWHDSVGNTLNIQVNDGTVASVGYSTGVFDSTSSFVIGGINDGTTEFWGGSIDAVGFWKRTLTTAERTALYNGGVGLRYYQLPAALNTSLVSWWDLEEASGTRKDQVVASGNDLTSNNSVGIADGIALSAAVDGDAVRQWNSGSLVLAQATGTARPLYKANIVGGKPVLRFDGVDDVLKQASTLGLSAFTLSAVLKMAAVGARKDVVADGNAFAFASNNFIYGYDTTTEAELLLSVSALKSSALSDVTAAFGVHTVDTGVSFFQNGTAAGTATTQAMNSDTTNTSVGASISGGSTNNPAAVDVAELVIVRRVLAATERKQLERYLGAKYAITVT